jgi:hypothetical protein
MTCNASEGGAEHPVELGGDDRVAWPRCGEQPGTPRPAIERHRTGNAFLDEDLFNVDAELHGAPPDAALLLVEGNALLGLFYAGYADIAVAARHGRRRQPA